MEEKISRKTEHHPELLSVIRSLENHVGKHPDDVETYYHLGHLYECVIDDDGRAKANYLQYLIRSLGYLDVDEAITGLEWIIDGEADNCMARINLGQIYCYQNRFDEAEAQLKAGTRWLTFETANFRLHVIPGSQAHRDIELVKRRREDALKHIQKIFRITYDRKEPIVYYFYESRVHKGMLTGDQMPGHVFTDRGEVHVVYNLVRQMDTPHEDAHIVLKPLGRPPKLIEEGAALYVHHGTDEDGTRLLAGKQIQAGIITMLLDDDEFRSRDLFVVYQIAHYFVRFLISEYGMDAFKTLYGLAADRPHEAFDQVYEKPLTELEEEWRRFVTSELPEANHGQAG